MPISISDPTLLVIVFVACSLCCVPHHCHELLEVNLAIAIRVHLSDGRVELLCCVHVSELITAKKLQKLVRVDLAAAIFVKHLEGCLKVGLTSERLLVHRSRQKLCQINKIVLDIKTMWTEKKYFR